MFLFSGKVDFRVIVKELDRIIDLRFAAVFLDRDNKVIDVLEELFVLAVNGTDADRQFFRPFHTTPPDTAWWIPDSNKGTYGCQGRRTHDSRIN
jgi:hypothetical protein